MNEELQIVPMYLINAGTAGSDGEFNFELQARANAGRTVRFALVPAEAHQLREALNEYFKVQR